MVVPLKEMARKKPTELLPTHTVKLKTKTYWRHVAQNSLADSALRSFIEVGLTVSYYFIGRNTHFDETLLDDRFGNGTNLTTKQFNHPSVLSLINHRIYSQAFKTQ